MRHALLASALRSAAGAVASGAVLARRCASSAATRASRSRHRPADSAISAGRLAPGRWLVFDTKRVTAPPVRVDQALIDRRFPRGGLVLLRARSVVQAGHVDREGNHHLAGLLLDDGHVLHAHTLLQYG